MTSNKHRHSVEMLLKDYEVQKQNKQRSQVIMYHDQEYGKKAQENSQILEHGT